MKRETIQNVYMFDTKVENIFISEYMISAPGNFVKVYLVALMYIDLGQDITNEKIARILSIETEEVERAWRYWIELGVVKMKAGEIIIPQLKEQLYGIGEVVEERSNSSEAALHILNNGEIAAMFSAIEKVLNRPVTGKETDAILSWIDIYGAVPEVISFAYKYCVERKKEAVNYIGKVVEGWTGRGFTTVSQVEKFLEENDQRHYVYKRIMKALGFHRIATEEERRIIDTWVDEFNLSMESILAACSKTSGIANPNINYVNAVLTSDKKEKKKVTEDGQVSRKHVMDYYDFIRNKAEKEAAERRSEIVKRLPVITDIENKIRKNYVNISKLAVNGGADKLEKMATYKKENERYSQEIDNILNINGIPKDYMDVHYSCPICKDTGTNENGQQCICYMERSEEASNWNG